MTAISYFLFETLKTTFFSRWKSPCLSGVVSLCWIVPFNRASWSTPFALSFLCRIKFEWTCSAFQARAFWHPRSTPFAFVTSSVWIICCCPWSFFLRNQQNLLLRFEDVIDHNPHVLLDSRLFFQNNVRLIQCQSVVHECRLPYLPLVQFLETTVIQIITEKLVVFLPKLDWTSWSFRRTIRHQTNHSRSWVCSWILLGRNSNSKSLMLSFLMHFHR